MSIADQENIRQLLKRVDSLEQKVKQLEAAHDLMLSLQKNANGFVARAKKAVERISEI